VPGPAPFTPFPVLQTRRLTLRQLRLEDSGDLFGIFSDPETMQWWSGPPHASVDETGLMIERSLELLARGDGIEWAVTRTGDDRLIGKVCHHRWLRTHRRSEIGYVIDRREWRQGIATEAVRAILGFGFEHMSLHSVEAQLDPGNVGSAGLLEQLEFVREGLLRDSFFNGSRFCDTSIYSLLARSWR
jgi:RimJ/RimL family protein N-acetyltransferase